MMKRLVIAVTLILMWTNVVLAGPNFTGQSPYTQAAEYARAYSARYWTGKKLQDWHQPCPITTKIMPTAIYPGGATRFVIDQGQVYGWSMDLVAKSPRALMGVSWHETDHAVRHTITRRKIVRWMDEGCANIFNSMTEHRDQREKAWRYKDHPDSPWHNFDKMEYGGRYADSGNALYCVGLSMVEWLLDIKGQGPIIEFQKDSGIPSQKFSKHFGITVAQARQAWEQWFVSRYTKAGRKYDCHSFGCATMSHRPKYVAAKDPFTSDKAEATCVAAGNGCCSTPTTNSSGSILGGYQPEQYSAPSTFPVERMRIDPNCPIHGRGVNPTCATPPPPEYQQPPAAPQPPVQYDADCDRKISLAMAVIQADLADMQNQVVAYQKAVDEKISNIEYEQPDDPNTTITLNSMKLELAKLTQRVDGVDHSVEIAALQAEIEALKKQKTVPVDLSPLMKHIQELMAHVESLQKELDALKKTKIPIQILREDGKLIDEDVYDLGEPIKLRIIPKRKGGTSQ